MLASGECSCLVVEASGRPLVSLGSDIADRGGDGRYISKQRAMGPGERSEAQVEMQIEAASRSRSEVRLQASVHVLDKAACAPLDDDR